MQKLELFDETFDPDRTESYELSIQLTLDGFCFCVKDHVRNCFISIVSSPFKDAVCEENWKDPFASITSSYSWLKKSFRRVSLSFESPIFTIVPQDFFEPTKGKSLLETLHFLSDFHEIKYNTLHEGITSIYSIPSALVSEWIKIQPKTHFLGFNEPIMAFHRFYNQSSKNSSITLAFSGSFATVIISKGLQLNACTTLPTHNHTDALYHLVNMCKNLEIPLSETHVKVIGLANGFKEQEPVISRFFDHVSFNSDITQSHFSYLLTPHKNEFANLFNQSLCEL